MAITIGTATAGSASVSAPVTVNKPASVVEGTLMLAFQFAEWGSYSELTASGWTLVTDASHDETGSSGGHFKTWKKIAGPSEPSTYDFGQNNGADGVVAILPIFGAGATPTLVCLTDDNTTDTAPSVSAPTANDLLICIAAVANDAIASRTWTPPSGMTEQADISASYCSESVATLLPTGASGATGTKDFTPSSTNNIRSGSQVQITVVVQDPGGGGGGGGSRITLEQGGFLLTEAGVPLS